MRKKKSWILVMESLGRKSSRSDLRREEKWLEDDTEDVQEQEEIGMRCESLGRKFVLVRTTTEIKVTSDVSQKLGNTVVSRSSFSRSPSLPLLISELNTDFSSNLSNLPFHQSLRPSNLSIDLVLVLDNIAVSPNSRDALLDGLLLPQPSPTSSIHSPPDPSS